MLCHLIELENREEEGVNVSANTRTGSRTNIEWWINDFIAIPWQNGKKVSYDMIAYQTKQETDSIFFFFFKKSNKLISTVFMSFSLCAVVIPWCAVVYKLLLTCTMCVCMCFGTCVCFLFGAYLIQSDCYLMTLVPL